MPEGDEDSEEDGVLAHILTATPPGPWRYVHKERSALGDYVKRVIVVLFTFNLLELYCPSSRKYPDVTWKRSQKNKEERGRRNATLGDQMVVTL